MSTVLPPKNTQAQWTLFALVLLVALWHVWASWGTPGIPWGDYGALLGTIERFAHGEVPYRDFSAPYPPVGYWILGSIASVVGTDLNQIWSATAGLFILLSLVFCWYASSVLPESSRTWIVLTTLLFALAFGNFDSAPLPLGSYSPPGVIGVILILAAVSLLLRFIDRPRLADGVLIGFLCGTCLFTKHDVWVPAVYIVCLAPILVWRNHRALSKSIALSPVISAAVSIVGYTLFWIARLGAPGLRRSLFPTGEIGGNIGRGAPSWERVVVELCVLGLIGFIVAGIAWAAGVRNRFVRRTVLVGIVLAIATGILHVGMSYRIGSEMNAGGVPEVKSETQFVLQPAVGDGRMALIKSSIRFFQAHLRSHILPFLLPIVVLILAKLYPPRLAGSDWMVTIFLLGLCVTLRLRRQFEHVDWFHFLVEMPVYFLVLSAYLREPKVARRVRVALVSLLIVLAADSYYTYARGPLTARNDFVPADTVRGKLYLQRNQAGDMQWLMTTLDGLDPARSRPLLMQGYASGYSYYVGRPISTHLTDAFFLSAIGPESALEEVRRLSPPPFFLANRSTEGTSLRYAGLSYWDYQGYKGQNLMVDLPIFQNLTAGCRLISEKGSGFYRLYDCAPSHN